MRNQGIKHMTFAVEDTQKVVNFLKARGVDVAMDVTFAEQTPIAFIRDNTGNLIEQFQQPDLWN